MFGSQIDKIYNFFRNLDATYTHPMYGETIDLTKMPRLTKAQQVRLAQVSYMMGKHVEKNRVDVIVDRRGRVIGWYKK